MMKAKPLSKAPLAFREFVEKCVHGCRKHILASSDGEHWGRYLQIDSIEGPMASALVYVRETMDSPIYDRRF